MIEVQGKYNTAKIFTDFLEPSAMAQVIELCSQEFAKDSKIRIMPDVHSGAGCVIGTSMTISDKIVPNLVGVDIGCGVHVVKLYDSNINFEHLDNVIRTNVPSGFNIRAKEHRFVERINFDELRCKAYLNIDRAKASIGTLGGGNHYIEVNVDSNGYYYLSIHSGSRYLGKQIAEHYQEIAIKKLSGSVSEKKKIVAEFTASGRQHEIQAAFDKIKPSKIPKDLCYLEGTDFDDYIHDMKIAQEYATVNREAIADVIMRGMNLSQVFSFTTVHNYIDTRDMILRKGAVSAKNGEMLIIPINMRDGSLLCVGKGNPEYNFTAPHGAGRLSSRSEAKKTISMDEFEKSMEGIWTTSVCPGTLDESPMAYKPVEAILGHIEDTVAIIDILETVYNFKAS